MADEYARRERLEMALEGLLCEAELDHTDWGCDCNMLEGHRPLTREEKNHWAYMDVLDSKGPTMPHDDEYMEMYRFFYPLGTVAAQERQYEDDCL